jgi:RNA polymerase sigma-70 factor, ECF subfamily
LTETVTTDLGPLIEPYRRELLAYCYRMLGSVHDAEDLVQETYLRALRGHERFEGRSSLRTWLYRIATNTCLRELERGHRRSLPSGLVGADGDPERHLAPPLPETAWLQPIPDALLDPAVIVASRDGIRLALIAALQVLPARQRAVLILRDVLAWSVAEVATLLDTSVAAVNSALQRARHRLEEVPPKADELSEPDDPVVRELLAGYVKAFENADMDALTRVLTKDVTFEMPPIPTWFAGRDVVVSFLATRLPGPGRLTMMPTRANGDPAFGVYLRGTNGVLHAHALLVLGVTRDGVARHAHFLNPGLFGVFDLPDTVMG